MKTWKSFFISLILLFNFNPSYGNDGKTIENILMDESTSEKEVIDILNWIDENENRKEILGERIFQRALNDIRIGGPNEFKRQVFVARELLGKGLKVKANHKIHEDNVYQYLFKYAVKEKDIKFVSQLIDYYDFLKTNQYFSPIDYIVFQGDIDLMSDIASTYSSDFSQIGFFLNSLFSKSYIWAVRKDRKPIEKILIKEIFLRKDQFFDNFYLPPLVIADLILNNFDFHSDLFQEGSFFENWKEPFLVYQFMKNALQKECEFSKSTFLEEFIKLKKYKFKKSEKNNEFSYLSSKNFFTQIGPFDNAMEIFYAFLESDFFSLRKNLESQELKEKFIKLKKFCLSLLEKDNTKEFFNQFQNFYQRLMKKGLRLLVSQASFQLRSEKNEVKGIIMHLVEDALKKNHSFEVLNKAEDFDKMNANFQLEKFSKIKLKDSFQNLSFEEVSEKEKEIFKIWETMESDEKYFLNYIDELFSCINNEDLQYELIKDFNPIERYQAEVFDKMNADSRFEESSEIKLKDSFQNLSFEEVSEKEIFKTLEPIEDDRKFFLNCTDGLVSCINNEDLQYEFLKDFNSIERYQRILLNSIKEKFNSNFGDQELDSILKKLIKVSFRTIKDFFKDLLMDTQVSEKQVLKILSFLRKNNAFDISKWILEEVLKKNFHFFFIFRENNALMRTLTIIRESLKYEVLLENEEIFMKVKKFFNSHVANSELIKMAIENEDILFLKSLIKMNDPQKILEDFSNFFEDEISIFHFSIDGHYLKAFEVLLKLNWDNLHPCGVLYECKKVGNLSVVDYSALKGKLEVLKLMWDHFSVNLEERKGLFKNALNWAIHGNQMEVIQYLLNQGGVIDFSKIDFSKLNKITIAFLILISKECLYSNQLLIKEQIESDLLFSCLPQEWKKAKSIFSSIKKIGKKIGEMQVELAQNANGLEEYLIKTNHQEEKEVQHLIEELKKEKAFFHWDLIKENVYALFQVSFLIEKLMHWEEGVEYEKSIMHALKNFYIAFAWMKRGEKPESQQKNEKESYLRAELNDFTDFYSIWMRLMTFSLRLFITQKNFSNPDVDLKKAKKLLFNLRKYDPYQSAPLEGIDSFHKIHPGYLEECKFGLEGLFRIMKENVLEKIIQDSDLSFDELFAVKGEICDLIEHEKFSCLKDYRNKIYLDIKNESLKFWLQEWEKKIIKRGILDGLMKRKTNIAVQEWSASN